MNALQRYNRIKSNSKKQFKFKINKIKKGPCAARTFQAVQKGKTRAYSGRKIVTKETQEGCLSC